MATYAVLSGNVVVNVLMSGNEKDAEQALGINLVEYTLANPAGIGWTYDGVSFTPPVAVELPPAPTDWVWNGETFVPPTDQ